MNRTVARISITVAVLAFIAPAVWLFVTVFTLGLAVDERQQEVVINVGWLGEYESSLSEITVTTFPEGAVVWQARPAAERIGAWSFSVRPGTNPRLLAGLEGNQSIRVTVPPTEATVVFQGERKYRIRIASSASSFCLPWFTCREAVFRLP